MPDDDSAAPAPIPTTAPASPAAADPEYLIDGIFPAHEVHLLGGPSGSGKTSLTFQLIEDFAAGRPIFGRESHPVPLCYVACDRSLASTRRTMRRLGVTSPIPIISLVDNPLPRTIEAVTDAAQRLVPNLRLLVIDAIGVLTPDGKVSDYGRVNEFLTRAARLCKSRRLTILGLGHSTKTKEGEEFKNPRQRFLGSVAWGGFSDTMIHIEPAHPDKPQDPTRTVMLMPRNERGQSLAYLFDDFGKLVPIEDRTADFFLDTELSRLAPSGEFTTAQAIEWGEKAALSRATVERWLSKRLEEGKIEKALDRARRGVYRRVTPS